MRAFFTMDGVQPASVILQHPALKLPTQFSIFLMNDSFWFVLILFAFGIFFAISFMLGWRTRITGFMMWFFSVSLHIRNQQVIGGQDFFVGIVAFWAMFIPLGDKYSWDERPGTHKTAERSFATFALMAQLCYLYLFATYYKTIHPVWVAGNGFQSSLQIAPMTLPLGFLILQSPQWLLTFLSWAALAVEGGAPLMMLSPFYTAYFRIAAFILLAILQLGIFLTLDVVDFPYASFAVSLPFIPAFFWDAIARWRPLKRPSEMIRRVLTRPKFLGPAPTPVKFEPTIRRVLAMIALFFSLCSLGMGLEFAKVPGVKLPRFIYELNVPLRFNQPWNMFARPPSFRYAGMWYVIPAKLKNGTELDLFQEKPIDWSPPRVYRERYRNSRWKIFVAFMLKKDICEPLRPTFIRYLVKGWNARHEEDAHVAEASIVQVWNPPNGNGEIAKKVLYHYTTEASAETDSGYGYAEAMPESVLLGV